MLESRTILLILFILITNCLKVKKSPFDMTKPSGLAFGIFSIFFSNSDVTLSGTIEGKALQDSITLTSGAETKVFQNTNSFGFTYPRNQNFSIDIVTNPSGLSCSMLNNKGYSSSNISNILVICEQSKPSLTYPTNGKNWGDYIQRDYSKDILSQTDSPCDPNSASNKNYFSCIHGAEILQVELKGKTSCDGITASDNANQTGGALNWNCIVKNSKVIVYSTGFREGDLGALNTNPPPGLSDLIDWTSGNKFKSITLTVKDKDIVYLQTTPSTWWNNSFVLNPSCATSLVQGAQEINTIYTFSSSSDYNVSQASPCQMDSDKTSFVIDPKIRLTNSISGGTLLLINNRNFNWIEGYFHGLNKNTNVFLSDSKFLVARNLTAAEITGGGGAGFNLRLSNMSLSLFKNVIIANSLFVNPGIGVNVESSSMKNIFHSMKVFNNSATGINLNSAQSNLFIHLVTSANNGVGLNIPATSDNNFILNSTHAFNATTGITTNANNTLIMNPLITNNNSTTNFGFDTSAANLNLTVLNIGLFNNNSNANSQIQSSGNGTTNYKKYLDQFKLSFLNCTGGGTSFDGISATNCNPIGQSDFTVGALINFSTSNPFVSIKASSDSLNSSVTASGLPLSSITNFSRVQSFYRVYGLYSLVNFPNFNLIGRCTTQCTLYDFGFSLTDSSGVRNSNPCPQNLSRPTLS
ncbi:MAG TPA: hypothetical protein PKX55_19410, partial [Leptospiraceae bacterium]|nr:hypothetical protein [Leptospiraceae bacterium]